MIAEHPNPVPLDSTALQPLTIDRTHPDALAIDSLVDQTVMGDERAFARLVAHLSPQVRRWVASYASGPDEVDDMVQEAFVLVLRRLRQYRGRGSFQGWLYRLAVRAALRTRSKSLHRAVLAGSPRAIPDRLVYETDPGGRVDRERLGATIRELWRDLPERQRVVVDLVDLQGYTPSEAAEMLDLNASTLRANLFKGRQALRSRLLSRYPSLASGSREIPS